MVYWVFYDWQSQCLRVFVLFLELVDFLKHQVVHLLIVLCTSLCWKYGKNKIVLNLKYIIISYVPFWDFTSPVTSFTDVIKGLSQFASISSWCITIDAYVEILTVFWISIPGMSYCHWLIHFWTFKLEDFCKSKTENMYFK